MNFIARLSLDNEGITLAACVVFFGENYVEFEFYGPLCLRSKRFIQKRENRPFSSHGIFFWNFGGIPEVGICVRGTRTMIFGKT